MRLKKGQLKLLEQHFEICTFKLSGDCECNDGGTGTRCWYERTSYEYDEGNYYCDKCGLQKIKDMEEEAEWWDKNGERIYLESLKPKPTEEQK